MNAVRRICSRAIDKLLSRIERTPASDRLILRVLFFLIIFSGAYLLYSINADQVTQTPVRGGILKEGIVGTPRFVNPVLANTRADHDMVALVYSGLLKISPSGELIPDLAESITVSEDGLTYNIILRRDIFFHDGTPVTSDDVIFTIQLIQNPDLKSPLRGNWTDVALEQVNEHELNVVLSEPYSPFMENFLIGIMPEHLWSSLPVEQLPFSQLNTEPIGSGPFQVVDAERDTSGVIKSYTLTGFQENPHKPNIEQMIVRFYASEEGIITDLKQNLLDASAYISNENLDELSVNENLQVIQEPLPRVFGIFLNQNKSAALRDDAVRTALSTAISRSEIIDTALYGYGVPTTQPIPTSENELESEEGSEVQTPEQAVQAARTILEEAGWQENSLGLLEKEIDESTETLSITLRTSNAPIFTTISNIVTRQWEEAGLEVSIDQYEQTDLVQSVIRPRDFEALLFGLDMNRSQDLYPFWHSSQQNDPGLNIAQYTNLTVDELLETARTEQDLTARHAILHEAAAVIEEEHPALFLFQPMTTYVVNKNFIVPEMNQLGRPSDRFSNMNEWYTNSDELWNIFRQK